jgi:hypothetical protein
MINVIAALDAVYNHITGQKVKSSTVSEAVRRFELVESETPKINKIYDDEGMLLVECIEAVINLQAALTKVKTLGNIALEITGDVNTTQTGSTTTEMVGDIDLLHEGSNNIEMTGDRNTDITGGDNLIMTDSHNIDVGGALNQASTGPMSLTSGDTLDIASDGPLSIYGDGVYMGGFKSGTSQIDAGANSGEVWIDSADLTLKMGV